MPGGSCRRIKKDELKPNVTEPVAGHVLLVIALCVLFVDQETAVCTQRQILKDVGSVNG